MRFDLKNDVAVFSSLTTGDSKRLSSLCCDLIGNDVMNDEDPISSIDIGIGTLHIQKLDTSLKYKFEPCEELEKSLLEGVKNKNSTLAKRIESSITEVLVHSYKDLL